MGLVIGIYRGAVCKVKAGPRRNVSVLRTRGESVDKCVGRPMSVTLMEIYT
jgi:hypothetical protein